MARSAALRVIGWILAAPLILAAVLVLLVLGLWAGVWLGYEVVDFFNGAFHE